MPLLSLPFPEQSPILKAALLLQERQSIAAEHPISDSVVNKALTKEL
ncbi:MAG: hypothetical protein U5M23_14590 [Marinagarivorans sp.]|nr:hypothetical protein [Marinagarivorans sp.]